MNNKIILNTKSDECLNGKFSHKHGENICFCTSRISFIFICRFENILNHITKLIIL